MKFSSSLLISFFLYCFLFKLSQFNAFEKARKDDQNRPDEMGVRARAAESIRAPDKLGKTNTIDRSDRYSLGQCDSALSPGQASGVA
jgi:hypothetical protein